MYEKPQPSTEPFTKALDINEICERVYEKQ